MSIYQICGGYIGLVRFSNNGIKSLHYSGIKRSRGEVITRLLQLGLNRA